jgi:hypothetical protein
LSQRQEIRTPRATITQRLRKIAGRIADQPEVTFEARHVYLPGIHRGTFRVTSLWVTGSWARGALDCGDLDLYVAIKEVAGSLPELGTIRRLLLGKMPHVSLVVVYPSMSLSDFPAADGARLVWSQENPDYEDAIEKVTPEPSAGHFPRPTDALPVRFEQTRCTLEEGEELLRLKDEGIIAWEWLSKDILELHPERWCPRARIWLKKGLLGKKTSEVAQYIFEVFAEECTHEWEKMGPAEFTLGTVEAYVGWPYVPIHRLVEGNISTLVIAPHFSRRGPNGLWFIRRGSAHPCLCDDRLPSACHP